MGLMDFLGYGPMSEKRINKSAKLATNKFAQPDVRVRELERLMEDGSPEAILGALKRFSVNSNGAIADEEEKKWLEDEIVGKCGDSALASLEKYIGSEKQLTYALRAYRRLSGDTESVKLFTRVLKGHGPDAYRQGEAKLQLVLQLSEHVENSLVLSTLVPFLLDHSDDVRWAVMDTLETGIGKGAVSEEVKGLYLGQFKELLFESGTGPRIVRRAAEFLSGHQWALGETVEEIPPLLDEDYFLDKKGFIRKRAARASISG